MINALASDVAGPPQSLHRGENELPFVPYQEGVLFQLLQVNTEAGLWVIRVRFEPGVTIQKHRHTGEVFAFTIRGSWRYLEYPDINVAGSYLFEPAHGHELGLRSGTVNVARQVRMRVGVNIMFGNWHKNQTDSSRNLADEVHTAWAVGSLCYLKPRYTGVLNQWTQGGATVQLHEDKKSHSTPLPNTGRSSNLE